MHGAGHAPGSACGLSKGAPLTYRMTAMLAAGRQPRGCWWAQPTVGGPRTDVPPCKAGVMRNEPRWQGDARVTPCVARSGATGLRNP